MIVGRNEAIGRIRAALRRRSGKSWSVRGGQGTAWGWINITAPPTRNPDDHMGDEDRDELAQLLGLDRPVHIQGVSIAASTDYYNEYVDRAEGRTPSVIGSPYWD